MSVAEIGEGLFRATLSQHFEYFYRRVRLSVRPSLNNYLKNTLNVTILHQSQLYLGPNPKVGGL